MAISFLFTAIVALVLPRCIHGSVTCQAMAICQVMRIPLENGRDGNAIITRFDFIPRHSAYTDRTSCSTSSTTEPTTVTANKSTTVTTSTRDTASTNKNGSSVHGRKKRQTTSRGKKCTCEFSSETNITIRVLKLFHTSSDKTLILTARTTHPENTTSMNLTETVTFTTSAPVQVDVEDSCFYSLFLEIEGDVTEATCNGSMIDILPEKTSASVKSELLLDTGLLIVGAVLAVIGFLLTFTGIAIWRRYRKKFKKQAKSMDTLEMKVSQQCNYEEISTDDKGHPHVQYYSRAGDDPGRKASAPPFTARKTTKEEDSSRLRSQSLGIVGVSGIQSREKTPSPDRKRHKKKNFFSGKKPKLRQESENKVRKPSSVDSDDKEKNSSVQEDYEDLSYEPHHYPHNIKVATPLVLLLNNTTGNPLRRTENLREAQIKATTMPKMELPLTTADHHRDGTAYAHLNRTGKSQSYHVGAEAIYDEATYQQNAVSKTSDVVTHDKNVFKFPTLTSYKAKGVTTEKCRVDEGRSTSVSSNQEEQDHIYEAYEKEEEETAGTEKPKPQNGYEKCVERNNDTTMPDDLTNEEHKTDDHMKAQTSQLDFKTEDDLYDTVSDHDSDKVECDLSDNNDDDGDDKMAPHMVAREAETSITPSIENDCLPTNPEVIKSDVLQLANTGDRKDSDKVLLCNNRDNDEQNNDSLQAVVQPSLILGETLQTTPSGTSPVNHTNTEEEYIVVDNVLYEPLVQHQPGEKQDD